MSMEVGSGGAAGAVAMGAFVREASMSSSLAVRV